jgi:hypothetical protein
MKETDVDKYIMPAFEADYAISIQPHEAADFAIDHHSLDQRWTWTGWKKHRWPADVIRKGLLLYGFDLRRSRRELFVLLRVTDGGTFQYRSMEEFVRRVRELTEWEPNPDADDNNNSATKWAEVERRLASRSTCTGICMRWRVVKEVSIPLSGRFPRLGWVELRAPNFGMLGVEPSERVVKM